MTIEISTPRLKLRLQSPEELRAQIDAMSPSDKEQLSPNWLTQVLTAETANPWLHGYTILLREENSPIGSCGFKGPPDADGVVEIAYGIAPEHQRKGYATEAAEALATHAFTTPQVKRVLAHTLPETNASTRVLSKCGFHKVSEVMDPEDGLVWRWERTQNESASGSHH